MPLNIAVQMDPIARINIRGDSTFALLLEAQKRGHGISYYTPDKLSLRGDDLIAPVQSLSVRDEVGNHFDLGEPARTEARIPAAASLSAAPGTSVETIAESDGGRPKPVTSRPPSPGGGRPSR